MRRRSPLAMTAAGLLVVGTSLGIGPMVATASAGTGADYYAAPTATGTGDCSRAADACTLDTAIGKATSGGDTIDLAGGEYDTDGYVLAHSVTIEPQSQYDAPLLVAGDSDSDVGFTVDASVTATVSGVAFQSFHEAVLNHGTLDASGLTITYAGLVGIDNDGTASVKQSSITSPDMATGITNHSVKGSAPTLTVSRVTVEGGGDGLTTSGGSTTVDDSTFAGTTRAIVATSAPVTLTSSTVSGSSGAGLSISGSTLDLGADLLAKNGPDCALSDSATLVDRGYDVDDDSSCRLTGTGSVDDSPDLAGYLGTASSDAGGPQTVPLNATSSSAKAGPDPALGLVAPSFTAPGRSSTVCTGVDERGISRHSTGCDAGAFEQTPRVPVVSLSATPSPGAHGAPVTVTATVRGVPSNGVPTGSVTFQVDGATSSDCHSATLGHPDTTTGTATASCSFSPLADGPHTFTADYVSASSDQTYTSTTVPATLSYDVGPAVSATTLAFTASTITATVTTTVGTGTPMGSVGFTAGGTTIGTVTLTTTSDTTATAVLHTKVSDGTVVASFYGTTDADNNVTILPSTTTVHGPKITATLTSARRKTKYGWYRKAVTVHFTCHAGSASVDSCPSSVTLTKNGKNQGLTRTATGADGTHVAVTLSHIDIDHTKPTLTVTHHVRSHHGKKTVTFTCKGHDSLSGVASCTVTHHKAAHGHVAYTATVTDKAGNAKTHKGTVKV